MIVRAIDGNHDWLFGKGKNNYLSGVSAVAQSINTRLYSFLGDCFFDVAGGIDWFNLLGSKNQIALNLAVSSVILNTDGVTGILQLTIALNAQRNLRITYTVSIASSTSAISTASGIVDLLTTEDGDIITTEDGDPLGVES